MSSIVLSTTAIDYTDSSETAVDIDIFVEDEDWLGYFNKLQVYRSVVGPSGPFEEITDEAWSAPRLPKGAGDPPTPAVTGPLVNLVGAELQLLVDHDQLLTITFTGSDPLTYAQAATQIAAQSNLLVSSYVDASGQLVIEGARPGLESRLMVIASEAAVILGLPTMEPDYQAQGKDPRLTLAPSQVIYKLRDSFGSKDYLYKTRFYNTATGEQGDATIASSPKPPGLLPPSTIIGYLDLVYSSGNVWPNAEVHLYHEAQGLLVEGKLVGGHRFVKYTDAAGHVEFAVVRGKRLTVSVQGSNFVRTITVPTDPSIKKFNFLDAGLAEDDVFTVSVPDIITAERRTL